MFLMPVDVIFVKSMLVMYMYLWHKGLLLHLTWLKF